MSSLSDYARIFDANEALELDAPAVTVPTQFMKDTDRRVGQLKFMPGYHSRNPHNYYWNKLVGNTLGESRETADPYNISGPLVRQVDKMTSTYEIASEEGKQVWDEGWHPDSSPVFSVDERPMSEEDYNKTFFRLKELGISPEWEQGMTVGQANMLNYLKLKEWWLTNDLQTIDQSGQRDLGYAVSNFVPAILYDNLRDPLMLWSNLAAWQKIPAYMGLRYAGFRSGMVAGMAASTAFEVPNYLANTDQGLNYTLFDSAMNVGAGTIFGGAFSKAMQIPKYAPQIIQYSTALGGDTLAAAGTILPSKKIIDTADLLKNISDDTKYSLIIQKMRAQIVEGKSTSEILTVLDDPKFVEYLGNRQGSYQNAVYDGWNQFNFKNRQSFVDYLALKNDDQTEYLNWLAQFSLDLQSNRVTMDEFEGLRNEFLSSKLLLDPDDPTTTQFADVGFHIYNLKAQYGYAHLEGFNEMGFFPANTASDSVKAIRNHMENLGKAELEQIVNGLSRKREQALQLPEEAQAWHNRNGAPYAEKILEQRAQLISEMVKRGVDIAAPTKPMEGGATPKGVKARDVDPPKKFDYQKQIDDLDKALSSKDAALMSSAYQTLWPEVWVNSDLSSSKLERTFRHYAGPNMLTEILLIHPDPVIKELGKRMQALGELRRGDTKAPDVDPEFGDQVAGRLRNELKAGLTDKEIDNLDILLGNFLSDDDHKILKQHLKGNTQSKEAIEGVIKRLKDKYTRGGGMGSDELPPDVEFSLGYMLFLHDADPNRFLDIEISPMNAYKLYKADRDALFSIHSASGDAINDIGQIRLKRKPDAPEVSSQTDAPLDPKHYMLEILDHHQQPKDVVSFLDKLDDNEKRNVVRFLLEWGPVMEHHNNITGRRISIGDILRVLDMPDMHAEYLIAHERAHLINQDFQSVGRETLEQRAQRISYGWKDQDSYRAEVAANLSAFNYVNRLMNLRDKTLAGTETSKYQDVREIAAELLHIEGTARLESSFYYHLGVKNGRRLLNNYLPLVKTAEDANVIPYLELTKKFDENGEHVGYNMISRRTDPENPEAYYPFEHLSGAEYIKEIRTASAKLKENDPRAKDLPIVKIMDAYTSIIDIAIEADGRKSNLGRIGYDTIGSAETLNDGPWAPLANLNDFITHCLINPEWQKFLVQLDSLDPTDARKHPPAGWHELGRSIEEIAGGIKATDHNVSALRDITFNIAKFMSAHPNDLKSPKVLYNGLTVEDQKILNRAKISPDQPRSERVNIPEFNPEDPLSRMMFGPSRRFNELGDDLDKLNLIEDSEMSPEVKEKAKKDIVIKQREQLLQLRVINNFKELLGSHKGDASKALFTLINGSPKQAGADQFIRGKERAFLGNFIGELEQVNLLDRWRSISKDDSKLIYEAMWALDHNAIEQANIATTHIPSDLLEIAKIVRAHRQEQMAEVNEYGGDMAWTKGHARARTTSPNKMLSSDGFFIFGKNQNEAIEKWMYFVKNNNLNKELTFKISKTDSHHMYVDPDGILGKTYLAEKTKDMRRDLMENYQKRKATKDDTIQKEGIAHVRKEDPEYQRQHREDQKTLEKSIAEIHEQKTKIVRQLLTAADNGKSIKIPLHEADKYMDMALYEMGESILSTSRGGKQADIKEKLGRERTLIFRGWEDNFNYDQQYASHSFQESIMLGMQSNARDLGMMTHFGKDPDDFINRLMVNYNIKDKNILSIKDYFNKLTGEADRPHNISLNKVGSALRTYKMITQLEKAMLSSIPDLANISNTLHLQGMKNVEAEVQRIKKYLDTAQGRDLVNDLGVGIEAFVGEAGTKLGFSEHSQAAISNTQKLFFKGIGMNYWNARNQTIFTISQAAHLGRQAKNKFYELPEELQDTLSRHGIGDHEWSLLRQGVVGISTETSGTTRPFIGIESVDKIPPVELERGADFHKISVQEFKQKLKNSLHSLVSEQMDQAVLVPNNKAMTRLHLGTQAGTWKGEAMRLATLYKAYAMSGLTKTMPANIRNIMNSPIKGSGIYMGYMAKAIAFAYIANSLKDVSRNNKPYDPFNAEGGMFSIRSLKGSGVLPFLGDMINQEVMESSRNDSEINQKIDQAVNTAAYVLGPATAPFMGYYNAEKARKEMRGRRADAVANRLHAKNVINSLPLMDYPLTSWATTAWINKYLMEGLDPGYNYRRNAAMIENRWGPTYELLDYLGINNRPGDAIMKTTNPRETQRLKRIKQGRRK